MTVEDNKNKDELDTFDFRETEEEDITEFINDGED